MSLRTDEIDILTMLEREHLGIGLPASPARERLRKAGMIEGRISRHWTHSRRSKRWEITAAGRLALDEVSALTGKHETGGAA